MARKAENRVSPPEPCPPQNLSLQELKLVPTRIKYVQNSVTPGGARGGPPPGVFFSTTPGSLLVYLLTMCFSSLCDLVRPLAAPLRGLAHPCAALRTLVRPCAPLCGLVRPRAALCGPVRRLDRV